MNQIIFTLDLRPTNTAGAVEMPVRITFQAVTPQPFLPSKRYSYPWPEQHYEWTRVEIKVGEDGDKYARWVDITEAPSIQKLLSIEYDTGRLFDVMDEHYRNQAALERAQTAAE